MIIEPKVRGFICTAAHPTGCFQNVQNQVNTVKNNGAFAGPKNVLIIGASTGYGLATRIALTFGASAKTIGVSFERSAAAKRTASPGWYNTAAFEQIAHAEGHYAKSINGDAFSDEIKTTTLDLIAQDLGQIDLLVYSLASPRRTDPRSGNTYQSTLKPIGVTYTNKTVDPMTGELKEVTLEPASDEDIANTIKVMGGEDWEYWVQALKERNLLAPNFTTLAYSYIGPKLTHSIYKEGTIGRAKDDLQATADRMSKMLAGEGGRALISVNKALVTQASSAIPVVPLYISILFKIMKEEGTHEGCIEQMDRLFRQHLYADAPLHLDEGGRIRVDDWEMDPAVQQAVHDVWEKITQDNINELTDLAGYREDFYHLFGFGMPGIDYSADIDVDVPIESIAVNVEG